VKARVCGCGHEESWHLANARDKSAPRLECNYGHDTAFGRCACTRFHRKRRGTATAFVASTPTAPSVSPLADAFALLEATVHNAFENFRRTLRSSSFQVQRDAPRVLLTNQRDPARDSIYEPKRTSKPSGKASERILAALAQHGPTMPKARLALLCGYSAEGGGFNNALSALRGEELITGSGSVTITSTGRARAPDAPSVPADLFDYWCKHPRVDTAMMKILLALRQEHGVATKDQIAARAGYATDGEGFNNALSRLRTLGLVDGRGGEAIRLAEVLRGAA
jgi:hypothetical protein